MNEWMNKWNQQSSTKAQNRNMYVETWFVQQKKKANKIEAQGLRQGHYTHFYKHLISRLKLSETCLPDPAFIYMESGPKSAFEMK